MSLSLKSQQTLSRFLRPGLSKQVRYASVLSTSSVPRALDTTQLTTDTLPPQLRAFTRAPPATKAEPSQAAKQLKQAAAKAQNVSKAKNALNQIEEVLFTSQEMLKTLKAQVERKELEHQLLAKQVQELREENQATRRCLEKLLCKLESIDTTNSQQQAFATARPKCKSEKP
ncbi:hypothetical protein K493DRAFT_310969 [Basidiobolus meristosporus CBS 931.73]|uniref:Uncharacterized protein n=1 Tax=Basidiobolus meristosporus CBS 931.73 TaxID=1314790 RepID=A0A1Y1Z5N8_9FUNG|nr:hypothetical protein K493DRAFT_310969 [Basidiobolus meristosporus CBS 931.73]|eukprot:ORY05434.1 hypothetical protein K493DRAFT_310969 [Basidiobolus meristosporus CBS 931.73]